VWRGSEKRTTKHQTKRLTLNGYTASLESVAK